MRFLIIFFSVFLAMQAADNKTERKDAPAADAAAAAPKPSGTTLAAAAARRNENVAVNRIDTDVLKESNIRLGVNYSILPVPLAERSYYTAEHGRPPSELSVLKPAPLASGFHADLFEELRNSVFNARTFFQSGPVKPSRQNSYGGRFTTQVRGL
ncbi:MAG: hypothetical protein IT167_04370 [Bryobacterales bacterium]|nr:hypothetical protein [Bryobacterales bacterium]